ncbi:Ig-like domain-containing protein [Myxococcota bacterium]|nr:Ig-like domain-containing protein [Myxococcota bacterium]
MAVLAVGCAPALPEASLQAVSPSWGWVGEETPITIEGEALLPGLSVQGGLGGEVSVDAQFSAALVRDDLRLPLAAVELSEYDLLTARVPSGQPTGLYDLEVITPQGDVLTLAESFTVSATRADRIGLDYESRIYTVKEAVTLILEVRDPDGEPVVPGEPVPVLITVESSLNGEGVVFDLDAPALLDAALLDDAVGVSGSIDADGRTSITFTSTLPDYLTVSVTPAEPGSPLAGAQAFIPFAAGALAEVLMTLEGETEGATDPLVFEAGVPFDVNFTLVDEDGLIVEDPPVVISLRDRCGGQVEPSEVRVEGQAQVPITVTRATGTANCRLNLLVASGPAIGESSEFEVLPGALSAFDLRTPKETGYEVIAGELNLNLVIGAVDLWDNAVVDYDDDNTLQISAWVEDASGDEAAEIERSRCEDWVAGTRFCSLAMRTAADALYIRAEADGVIGESGTLLVKAAAPETLNAVAEATNVIAGDDTLTLRLFARDRFENVVPLDALAAEDVLINDGEVTCDTITFDPTGMARLSGCVAAVAGSGPLTVAVTVEGVDLVGTTGTVTVEPGAVAIAELTAPTTAEAGESFGAELSLYDELGNLCTGGAATVTITPSAGSIAIDGVTTTTLAVTGGLWAGDIELSAAGDIRLAVANSSAVEIGDTTVKVSPASAFSLEVKLGAVYAWVGEPTAARVSVKDKFSNTVTDFSGTITLSSDSALFVSVVTADVVDGVAELDLTWDSAGLDDRVSASSSTGLSGRSSRVDALDLDCASGPTAALSFDGDEEANVCLVSGSASLSADATASVAGAQAISVTLFDSGVGEVTRTTSGRSTMRWDEAGVYLPMVIVADLSACADVVSGVVWVEEQGLPAGDVNVSLGHTSRSAGGSASVSDTTVSVQAFDCAGDFASGASLYVRTDLGAFVGPSATGEGLAVTLNSSGAASFTWSGAALATDGVATVHAGSLSGSAWGASSLTVTGDSTRPLVAAVSPSGATSETWTAITVDFNEPLAAGDYSGKATLTGPAGAVPFTTALSADGTRLTITPSNPVIGSAGAYTLTLSSATSTSAQIRDDSGNKLDGAMSGAASAWTSVFGAVGSSGLSMSSCAPSTTVITPDGDDTAASSTPAESDGLTMSLGASATPTRWRLTVTDASGALLRTVWATATGATQSVVWDGRGDDGRFVPAGRVTVSAVAIDATDNLSASCDASVTVTEHYLSPE